MVGAAYTTITINYDDMYDALTSGQTVWLYFQEYESSEMVLAWYLDTDGMYVTTYNANYVFPNGSHNLTSGGR